MLPPLGRLIAVDWGDLRIGLALSDHAQILASPLETLVRRAGKRFPMPRFLELVAEHRPVGVVVGLPLTGEGLETRERARGPARWRTRSPTAPDCPSRCGTSA